MDTNLKELKERTQRDIWTPMFLSSILDNSPKVEATQIGSMGIQNVVIYSALKRKDILTHG